MKNNKMRKLMVLMVVMAMTFNLVACGDDSSDAKEDKPATEEQTDEKEDKPVSEEEEDVAEDEEELVYTLDYDVIASWVDSGFIGEDETGSPVVMAIDAANETAIIIFGDNSDMTAASFVGEVTYDDTSGTIVDEANESSLTFGITQIAEDTIELDMGDIGIATIKAAAKEDVLSEIKAAIDNYTHIA
ncbi:MAG: hypothetical protein RSD28_05175 [Lachnospiraceae bacterium]